MSTTQFVEMYHPLIASTITTPVRVPLQSADDHAGNGWLLVDPDAAPTAPATPYYSTAASDSRFVRTTLLDTAMTAVAAADDSAFAVEQRAASVAAVEEAGYLSLAGQQPGDPIPVVKPTSDTRAGVWEYTHNSETGYLFHLLAGAAFGAPAALIALGNDNGDGSALLIANKASGVGITIDQRATVAAAGGYGLFATQRSPAAPLVRLEMQANDAAPVMQLLAFGAPGATQQLLYVGDPTGEAGRIEAANGRIRWQRPIVLRERNGGIASTVDVTENTSFTHLPDLTDATGRGYLTRITKQGLVMFSDAGAADTWWPFGIFATGSRLQFRTGGSVNRTGISAAPPATNVFELQHQKVGFFAATPQAQKTRVGALTDSSGGVASSTIAAAGASYDQAVENAFRASIAAKINALEALMSAAASGFGFTA